MIEKRIIVFVLILFLAVEMNAQSTAPKPNIIFILADDLGYGDVGCYGQQKIKTPNIDALAQSGMRFTHFYAGTAVCAPSRASLMTGLHTGHTPVRGNKGFKPEGQFPLPDSSVTIAMELLKAGYSTAAFGKWGLGFFSTSGSPQKKGFGHFYGYNCQSLAHNYYPDHLWANDTRIDFLENKDSSVTYSADNIQEISLRYIGNRDEPFFLFLPYTLPHADLTVPHDSVYYSYIKEFNEQPIKETDKRNLNKNFVELYPHAAFAAMVSRLDRYVGEIRAAVKASGMEKNTIIIFASDNGPHREKGGDPEFFDGNGIYRGIKRDLTEGGIRIPMIVSWPGTIKANSTSDYAGAFWDFLPTFQQLCGRPLSTNIDGISFVNELTGKKQIKHDYLYWEFHESGGKQAVRWKNWKAIRLDVSTAKPGAIELYDLSKDPSETKNIAARHPEIVSRMEKMMQEAHKPNPDWPLFISENKNP